MECNSKHLLQVSDNDGGGWRRSNIYMEIAYKMRQREAGEGAIFTWGSCTIHGLKLLHDTSAPPLTSFPLISLKL